MVTMELITGLKEIFNVNDITKLAFVLTAIGIFITITLIYIIDNDKEFDGSGFGLLGFAIFKLYGGRNE